MDRDTRELLGAMLTWAAVGLFIFFIGVVLSFLIRS